MESRAHISKTKTGYKLFAFAEMSAPELEAAMLTADGYRLLVSSVAVDLKRALDVWRQSEYSNTQDGGRSESV